MTNPPGVTESIVTGVLSGVLTSIGVAAFLLFVRKVVVPWYQSVTYSGINLSGTWHAVDPTMSQRVELTIRQTAKTVKGTAIFVKIEDDDDEDHNPIALNFEPIRSFTISGVTQDRFLALTLKHSDPNRLGINCYLLEVIGDGRRMAGIFSFYSINTSQIGESYHLLYRDRVEADAATREARRDLKERRKELLEELKENERQIEATEVGEENRDSSEANNKDGES